MEDELRRLAGQLPHTPAASSLDDAIPMLTEIVEVPRYDSADLPPTIADVDWPRLALRVQENVLERLLDRSNALLDEQLKIGLQAIIERTTQTLAAELHTHLQQMISELVARTVNEELTRVHDEITRAASDPQEPV
ncbi:MAG: hypothetical protein J0H09_03325 [Burkholderiales bacterium]|nr:hypothetical protein [Burkholderiales bacterium]